MNYPSAIWIKFVEIVDQNPRPLFAVMVGGLALLLCAITILLFARIRQLQIRHRQLGDNLDALSSLFESTTTTLEAEIHSLTRQFQATSALRTPVSKAGERERPAALMREELASLQMDLHATEPNVPDVPKDAN
jgi:hypothetical protein